MYHVYTLGLTPFANCLKVCCMPLGLPVVPEDQTMDDRSSRENPKVESGEGRPSDSRTSLEKLRMDHGSYAEKKITRQSIYTYVPVHIFL